MRVRKIYQQGAALWRLALAVAASVCVAMALMPKPPLLPGNPSDKLLHAAAFMTLAILARMAFPKAQAWAIVVWLSALGLAIECAQALPAVGRNASLADWLVDVAASAVGVVVIYALLPRTARWSAEP